MVRKSSRATRASPMGRSSAYSGGTPLCRERKVGAQRAVDRDVLARRGIPAEVAHHRATHHALPDFLFSKQRDGTPNGRNQALRSFVVESEPGSGPFRQARWCCVHYRVGKSTDPPNQRQGAITQCVELGQAARLEARGYKDHVGAADNQVCQALVIVDLGRDPLSVLRGSDGEAVLEIAVAGAEQGELAA